jgi:hypothetical protein
MTVAGLEIYGLSIRAIEAVERNFGVIYADDLASMTEESLLAGRGIEKVTVAEIKRVLGQFRDGRPVKTVDDCVRMSPDARKRPRLTHVQPRAKKANRKAPGS